MNNDMSIIAGNREQGTGKDKKKWTVDSGQGMLEASLPSD